MSKSTQSAQSTAPSPTSTSTPSPTSLVYSFEESSGHLHTVRIDQIARIDLCDTRIRTFIPNELELYDFDTPEQAKKVYTDITTLMANLFTTYSSLWWQPAKKFLD